MGDLPLHVEDPSCSWAAGLVEGCAMVLCLEHLFGVRYDQQLEWGWRGLQGRAPHGSRPVVTPQWKLPSAGFRHPHALSGTLISR